MQSTNHTNNFHVPAAAAGSSSSVAATASSLLGGPTAASNFEKSRNDWRNDGFTMTGVLGPFDVAPASASASAPAPASVTPRETPSLSCPTSSASSYSSSSSSLVTSTFAHSHTNDNFPNIPSLISNNNLPTKANHTSPVEVFANGLHAAPAQPATKKRSYDDAALRGIQAAAGYPLSHSTSTSNFPQVGPAGQSMIDEIQAQVQLQVHPSSASAAADNIRSYLRLQSGLLPNRAANAGSIGLATLLQATSVVKTPVKSPAKSPTKVAATALQALSAALAEDGTAMGTDTDADADNSNNISGGGLIPFFGFAGGNEEEEEEDRFADYTPNKRKKLERGDSSVFNKQTEMYHRQLLDNLSPANVGKSGGADDEENMDEKEEEVVEETEDMETTADETEAVDDNASAEVTCVAVVKDAEGRPLSLQTNTETDFSIAHKYLRKHLLSLQYEKLTENDEGSDNDEQRPTKVPKGKIAIANATHRVCIACKGCGQILFRPESFEHQKFYIGIMKQMRVHIGGCKETSETHKVEFDRLRDRKNGATRGRKIAWKNAASAIGLTEMHPVGITFIPPKDA